MNYIGINMLSALYKRNPYHIFFYNLFM